MVCSYASRDSAKADAYCRRYGGAGVYSDYRSAIEDPRIDGVVLAVPPRFHLDLSVQALGAGKHVLVEKPAYLRMDDYLTVLHARNRANRIVLVGENDHYKPLAVCLRKLLREEAIGEMVFAHFTTIAKRLKPGDDWRNDETMAGGDAFSRKESTGSISPAASVRRSPVFADIGRLCRGQGRIPEPRA